MLTCGKGKYKVFLIKKELDRDLVIIIGGGEKPHIGGIVFRENGKKLRTIKFESHYDHVVLKMIAEAASKKYKKSIVVTGGIHIDNATREDINILLENCKRLAEKI